MMEMQTRNQNHSYHNLMCRDDWDVKWYNDTNDKKSSSRCLSSTSEAFESESILKLANRQRLEKMKTHPKNARSFSAPTPSTLSSWSGILSRSSVGKYDVSVMDCRWGTKGGIM